MNKLQIKRVPAIKDFKGMNIISAMMYYKEELKRETNLIKRDLLHKRLEELKVELSNHK
jgi:hypothetical protein